MTVFRNRQFQVYLILLGLTGLGGWVLAETPPRSQLPMSSTPQGIGAAHTPAQNNTNAPKIQMAILLDTSNSMDGLIDQARNKLWQAVNEFAKMKRDGMSPSLEVAVYEYGNTNISSKQGHVRQVTPFTRELDQVSEALFSLTTNGGDEYCGYVIDKAVTDLQWSTSSRDIKAIFIAGNEPFTQGPLPFENAVKSAKGKGITVNTIHAGNYDEGVQTGWMQGALLAEGNYMSIDADQRIVHIEAPQDKKLAELNSQLNKTYVPYGAQGKQKAQRQLEQDAKSESVSAGLLAKRASSKASPLYKNTGWDLVDAVEEGEVKVKDLQSEDLPEEMKVMNEQARSQFVAGKSRERVRLKQEIAELSKAREAYVDEQKKQVAEETANTLNDALTASVREQGNKKGFVSLTP